MKKDELTAIRELYDSIADRYDRAQQGRFVRWLIRDARARAAGHARGRLLEVGIGSGATLPYYPDHIEVTGIDLSPGMLAHARRRLGELGRRGNLHVMDAQQLDFPDQHFDSVAFNLVLCTIPDQTRALREAIRVSRPGATMTFLEHVRSHRAWIALPQDLLNLAIGRVVHDRISSDTEQLIRSAGIEVISVDRWFLGAMTLIIARAPTH